MHYFLVLLFVLFPLSIQAEVSPDGVPPERILLAGSESLVVIDSLEVSRIPAEVERLAVDPQRQRMWTMTRDRLAARDWTGTVLWERKLPTAADAADEAMLLRAVVVPADGSLWVARGKDLQSWGVGGQPLHRLELSAPVVDLAVDSFDHRLWIATADELIRADALSGEILETFPRSERGPAITALAIQPSSDPRNPAAVWSVQGSELTRRDGADPAARTRSELQPEMQASALRVSPDGTFWIASGDALIFGRSDAWLVLQPFGKGEPISALALAPDGSGIWVAGPESVLRLGAEGRIVRELAYAGIMGMAVLPTERPGESEPEAEGPSLAFLEPMEGAVVSETRPELVLGVASTERLDLESLQIGVIDEDDAPRGVPISCAVGFETLRCRPQDDLPSGIVTLTASVANANGLRSDEISRGFVVDLATEDPDDDSEGSGGVEPVYTPVATPRGARPHVPFQVGEFDSIDTGSGNLTIRIPLGQSYEVGPKLSYRFQLVHNSNAWDFVNADWVQDNEPSDLVLGVPNPGSNAGLGWEIHFGKLFAPVSKRPAGMGVSEIPRWPNRDGDPTDASDRWMYVAPDGARYYLHRLPGYDAGTFELPIRYSKDGTLLRMRQTDASTVLVEMPDGLVSEFKNTPATAAGTDFCRAGVSGCWRLSETRDLYGNKVSFDYVLSGNVETWTITDSTGRSHTMVFDVGDMATGGGDGTSGTATDEGDEPGDVRRVLETVNLAAFGGTTATYTVTTSTHRISRPCPNGWEAAPSLHSIKLPILEEIELPDGTITGSTGNSPTWKIDTQKPYSSTAFCFNASGRVEKVTQPTKSSVEYGYANWRMPTRCTYRNSPNAEAEYTVDGVTSRTTQKADGTVEGTWTYSSILEPTVTADAELSGPGCKRANYRRTTVDAPAGANGKHKRTNHYRAVFQGPENPLENTAYSAWQVTDSGLPYSKHASVDDTDDRALFLSRQVFECNGDACGSSLRSTYRRYTSDYRQCSKPGGDSAGCFQLNPQMVAERTVFHDDGNRFVETQNDDNTGSARFRESTVLDNFGGSATVARSTDRNFTATGTTSISIDANTGYLQVGTPSTYLPDPGESWLLIPYDETIVSGDGRTYVIETEFDDKGSVVCKRTWKGSGTRGARDVVVKLTLGTTAGTDLGLPVTEVVSGGEYGELATNALCAVESSAENGRKYTYLHGYEHLQLASSQFEDADHYLYESDIDRDTGLETNVYDVSGLRTGLSFDVLGRIFQVSPEAALGGVHLEYQYNFPAAGGASVQIRHNTPAPNVALLLREDRSFDSFGRLVQETRRRPVGGASFSSSIQKTLYDALGRPTHVSTRQATANVDFTKAVRYGDYDVFDRPRTMIRPDGEIESLSYQGIRVNQSTIDIQTSESGTTEETRTTTRDALGRVIETTNPEYMTTFTFDPFDRQVTANRQQVTGDVIDQTRSYGIDARGYLLSEDHPEVDASITHKPDALGLSRETFDGLNTLRTVFDDSARLEEVRDSSGLVWKVFLYGSENVGTNRVLGRLQHVSRRNALAPEDLSIVETYEYREGLGKVSKVTTKLLYPERPKGSQFDAAFEQTFKYDLFGNVTEQSYPTCVVNGDGRKPCDNGNDVLPPSHQVTRTYNQAMPREVTSSLGPSATMAFHPNLQLSQITYGNQVVGSFDEGEAHLARPRKITYSNDDSTVLWTSGVYTFDGAGNVASIGNDGFAYDGASRLLSGTVGVHQEELTYDAADNVTSFARDGGTPVAHNIDSTNNHMLGRAGKANITYDSAGSITGVGFQPDGRAVFAMSYGPFRRQTSFKITASDPAQAPKSWIYGFGPGDVRLMVEDDEGERRWTFRDLDNRIVREFSQIGQRWTHEKDFIHGPSGLIATRHQNGTIRYFHADHLGTPRLLTAEDGTVWSRHDYYPFGGEIEDATLVQSDGWESGDLRYWQESKHEPRYEFTGHERDPHGLTDYMLARTYLYPFYRFASVDPARDGWNLYAYVGNNPMAYVDPDGRTIESALALIKKYRKEIKAASASVDEKVTEYEIAGVVFQENMNDYNFLRDMDHLAFPLFGGPETKNAFSRLSFLFADRNGSLGIVEMNTELAARFLGFYGPTSELTGIQKGIIDEKLADPAEALKLAAQYLLELREEHPEAPSIRILNAYNRGTNGINKMGSVGLRAEGQRRAILEALMTREESK